MSRFLIAFALCFGTSVAPQPSAAPSHGFVVVVNAANPVTSMSRTDLTNMFLKHTTKWPNGTVATVIDLRVGVPARDAFTKSVLGRSVDAVRSYWQQQIFSGRDVPPQTKQSDAQVLDAVKTDPGAVSYVDAHTELGQGVKAIPVTSK